MTKRALPFAFFLACSSEPSWPGVKGEIRERFPEVRQLSTEELSERIDARKEVLLLDVRQEREFLVSHLPGAIHVAPDATAVPALEGLDPDTMVVAYCSVGYRSSALVARLMENGVGEIYNLEGSIFEWANKGYPLERDGQRVREVHPFDESWGRLLMKDLHAYEPESPPR